MSYVEKIRVLVLLGATAGVFVCAGGIVGGALVRRIRRKPAPKRGAVGRWARRVVLVLAVVAVGCLAYAYFIEPYWLEETQVSPACDKLPRGSRPIRIVHISDLHCETKVRLEDELPDVVARMRPDVIVFTGDAINSSGALGNFQRCMKRLSAIAPTYAVLGNWDVNRMAGTDFYGGTGVRVLEGGAAKLEIGPAEVYFVGGSTRQWPQIERALRSLPPESLRVVLYHYPRRIYDAADAGADLYLAGHLHGGQVAMPFYGALVTLSPFGKRFERGLHRVQDTWMYVSRGIGLEGVGAPRLRFCARPEVTLIEIAPGP